MAVNTAYSQPPRDGNRERGQRTVKTCYPVRVLGKYRQIAARSTANINRDPACGRKLTQNSIYDRAPAYKPPICVLQSVFCCGQGAFHRKRILWAHLTKPRGGKGGMSHTSFSVSILPCKQISQV